MASRAYLWLSLPVAAVAGALIALTPATPALADEDPYYRAPPRRVTAPPPRRVVRTVTTTRTVWRTRAVCFDYNGQPFDCRNPAPVAPQPQIIGYTYGYTCGGCAPAAVAPPVQYYAPAASCGTCAPAVYVPPPHYHGCGDCAPAAYPYVHTHRYHGYGHRRYAPRHVGHGHGRYAHRQHGYHVAR